MTIAEYHDGVSWNTLATENYVDNYVDNKITNSINWYVNQSLFSNTSFTMTGNVATQSLAANTWTKLTYTASTTGVVLNAANGITGQNLYNIGANRITRLAETPSFNNWFKSEGMAIISSSNILTHNLSLQIVKNGVLSSILPYGFPTRVEQNGVAFGYLIKSSYFQLNVNEYIELYVLSTAATTITTSTIIMNLQNIG